MVLISIVTTPVNQREGMTMIDAHLHPSAVLSSVTTTPDGEYAEYKALRDKFKHKAPPLLVPAVEASTSLILNGLPYTVAFRNHALDIWRRLFDSYELGRETWSGWANVRSTCLDCINELRWHMEQKVDRRALLEHNAPLSHILWSNAVKWAANIHFDRKAGALIETTPALDTLLTHSDLHDTVPMRMFLPPFRAQYIRLNRDTAVHFATPEDRARQVLIDGVFCFVSKPEASAQAADFMTVIELVFVYNRNGQGIGTHMLRGPLIDPDESVTQWIDAICGPAQGQRSPQHESEAKLMNYLTYVFLYLGLKDARREIDSDYSIAMRRLARAGPKKQARLTRRLQSKYDRITVGPATTRASLSPDNATTGRAPHWRRGHFRSQPCGPSNSARKLIFVAPILIHAERLGDEKPRPKTYELA